MKMKVILSALLATAATISVAKAADSVVAEPEPVEYVRVCDAYGEGFFYIPGTETCMRIGGFIYGQVQGGDAVSARSRADLHPKTYRTETRAQVFFATSRETELGTLKSHIEIRSDYDDGTDSTTSQLRFGYIDLGGLHVGLDESAINTFFGYYGDFINDDVIAGGAYRTNMIQYTYAAANGLSAIISLEQGGKDETDYNGVIKDYTPHVVIGAKYEQGWGSLTAAGAYDSVNRNWVAKAKASFNVTDKLTLWVMGAYKDMRDVYYTHIDKDSIGEIIHGDERGVRGINSFYGTWGGRLVGWAGAEFKFNEKATANLQLAYEGAGNTYSALNVDYKLVPGLSLIPEINYRKWEDIHSDLKGSHAVGGGIRLQRDF